MVDTNALLSIAFTIISNFCTVVEVPNESIPRSHAHLQKCLIGSPYSPIDLHLVHKNGTAYWVRDGVVYRYSSLGSFFELQDPKQFYKFEGASQVTSNEVLNITSSILARLMRSGQLPTNGTPTVKTAGTRTGRSIPFYKVAWPTITSGPAGRGADVEIDGRDGRIVSLQLWDMAFRDLDYSQRIRQQVVSGEGAKPTTKPSVSLVRKFNLPQPTTNYAAVAIENLQTFCQRLDFEPDPQTRIEDVDWDKTWLYTNKEISVQTPVCAIWFTNGACFESIDGVTFSYFAEDACYTGFFGERNRSEWARWKGPIVKKVEDLATQLGDILVRQLGIPSDLLTPYSIGKIASPPTVGNEIIKRQMVEWRIWPNSGLGVRINETKLGFAAEFDLETGELKSIRFYDSQLIAAIGKAQGRAK